MRSALAVVNGKLSVVAVMPVMLTTGVKVLVPLTPAAAGAVMVTVLPDALAE